MPPERLPQFSDGLSHPIGACSTGGEALIRLATGIDWDSPEASAYFHRLLQRSGVEAKLRALGVKEGDTVRIGKLELEWSDAPQQLAAPGATKKR